MVAGEAVTRTAGETNQARMASERTSWQVLDGASLEDEAEEQRIA